MSVPFGRAQRLEQRKAAHDTEILSKVKILDLEEQIALMEKQINNGDDDEEEDSVSTEMDSDSEAEDDAGLSVERDQDGNVVRILSGIAKDAIEPLPSQMLPLPMCATRNSRDKSGKTKSTTSIANPAVDPSRKRSIRFADEEDKGNNTEPRTKRAADGSNSGLGASTREGNNATSKSRRTDVGKGGPGSGVVSGLEATIREMFSNYVPTSNERRPFWCRLCQFQGTDLPSFEEHRQSEQHLLAVDIEKKMAFCKLCKKNFTSMAQLKEHLEGVAHKERLAYVKQSQQQQRKGNTKYS